MKELFSPWCFCWWRRRYSVNWSLVFPGAESKIELRLNKIQSESFKQQGRWRLRKRHCKSRASSNFIALILSRLIRQMLVIFLELISKGLYQSSGKEKEICCSVFPFSTKLEIRNFHVVVVQRRQRNLRKSVMHVQSCFANIILLLFCRFFAVFARLQRESA